MGSLTYDENETVDMLVFRGLGVAKGSGDKPSNMGKPFIKDLPELSVKKEPVETNTCGSNVSPTGPKRPRGPTWQ